MSIGDEFDKTPGRSIYIDGQEIVRILSRRIPSGTRLQLRWRSATLKPLQGIRLKVYDGGTLTSSENETLKDIVLWHDTAPQSVDFVCNTKTTADVKVWNCWRDDRGVTQAWVLNASMRVSDTGPNSFLVECNSHNNVTFTDSVFELIFAEESKAVDS